MNSHKHAPAAFPLPVVDGEARTDTPAAPDAPLGEVLAQAAAQADGSERGYGKTYWRSLEEKLGGAGFLEATRPEFPEGADLPPTGVARREFMQLMGASLALAGLSACTTRPSNEKMLAYTKTPSGLAPGNPMHYASGLSFAGTTSGVLVTAYEGRPTKVEGNPEHPVNRGAAGVFEQASLLSLYDPQRARVLRLGKTPRALRTLAEDVAALVNKAVPADGGARVRFLLEPTSSPLLQAMRARVQEKLPKARFVSYATVSQDPASEGTRALFGQPVTPLYDFSKADVVLSLDADFLESRPANLGYARDFASRRDPNVGPLNRLYVCEARLSITGGMADHRLRLKSAEVLGVAAAVAQAVGGAAQPLAAAAGRFAPRPEHQKWIAAVAGDLKAAGARGLVVAGERQPAAVHALAHALNAALGSVGQTVRYVPQASADPTGPAGLRALVEEVRRGEVETLVITARNPVYASPADVGLGEVLDPARNPGRGRLSVLYSGFYEDETSAVADWFVPLAHDLEAWGDGRSLDGTVTLVQPLIQPLFSGVSEAELLALFLGEGLRPSHQLLREHWAAQAGNPPDFDAQWEAWVSQGFIPNSAPAPVSVSPNMDAARTALEAHRPPEGGELEVNFVPDYKVYDGRFANNAWLQELPDPITKMTWGNAAFLSPATARRLGLHTEGEDGRPKGEIATLDYGGRKLQVPIWTVPGQADDTVVLPLGYGRTGLHETASKDVGVNANLVRRADAPWFDAGAKLTRTGRKFPFALTQHHWRTEGRPIALDMSLEAFKKHPQVMRMVKSEPGEGLPDLLGDFAYPDLKWGMAIDLARCTGCSACTVACQAENNIPVVGKEQVIVGREMHWLRIDRYFSGDVADPEMVTQPMLCVHCEKAPCEYVCPVNATVHSDEGLNEMIYNRCVGTRYCQNNCPYKVRRFNYLHYNKGKTSTEKMLMNPDVTVRARGVIEKCSFCVQRIQRARIDARVQKRPIGQNEVVTACQQSCPTQAISFGSLHDKEAKVTKLHADARSYKVLYELGTQPRVAHLVRVRNPHPDLVAHAPAAGGHGEGGH